LKVANISTLRLFGTQVGGDFTEFPLEFSEFHKDHWRQNQTRKLSHLRVSATGRATLDIYKVRGASLRCVVWGF